MTKSLSPKLAIQRLRVKFSRGHELKYISHLDMMRLWERSLRRASIPVAYSGGFNPRSRLSFASPLAVGITSQSEILDIYLEQRIAPHHLINNVSKQLPDGIAVVEVYEIGLKVPSLQSQVSMAEYIVILETDMSYRNVDLVIHNFLKQQHVQWQHSRDNKTREYDIRALVKHIKALNDKSNECKLAMKLLISARPEQVALALGFTDNPKSIHRTNIILDSANDKR